MRKGSGALTVCTLGALALAVVAAQAPASVHSADPELCSRIATDPAAISV